MSPSPPSSDPRRARTRGAILTAARALWAERGLESTTVVQIAREAGVGVGSIYGHFGSKDMLALALVEDAIAGRADELAAARQAPSAEARISAVGAVCVRLAIDDPVVFRVLARRSMEAGPDLHPFDPVDPDAARALRRLDGLITELRDDLEEAVGGRPDVSVPVALASLVALWWGLAGLATRHDGARLSPELVSQALGLADRVLLAPAP